MPSFALPSIATWPISKPRSPRHSTRHSPATSVDLRTIPENFGVPDATDPDPFGVLALERAGLEIKEAGTNSRPSSDNFEFRPSPSSPIFRQSFQSIDAVSKRASKRDSRRSSASVDQGTQTADLPSPAEEKDEDDTIWNGSTSRRASTTPSTFGTNQRIESWTASVDSQHNDHDFTHIEGEQGHEAVDRRSSSARTSRSLIPTTTEHAIPEGSEPAKPTSPVSQQLSPTTSEDIADEVDSTGSISADELGSDDEEPVIAQVVQATPVVQTIKAAEVIRPAPAVQVVAQSVTSPRAKLVTIKSRPAPALPTRNPLRQRRVRAVNEGDQLEVTSAGGSTSSHSPSPTRSAFDHADNASSPWSEQTSIPEARSINSSKRNSFDHQQQQIGEDKSADEPPSVHDMSNEAQPFETGHAKQADKEAHEQQTASSPETSTQHAPLESSADVTTLELAPAGNPTPRPASFVAPTNLTTANESSPMALLVTDKELDTTVKTAASDGAADENKVAEATTVEIPQAFPELPSRSTAREVAIQELTPKLKSGSFDNVSEDDSPAESTTPRSVEDMVSKQQSLAPTPDADVSDAASVSDYGDETPMEQDGRDEDDETRGSEVFHSIPSTPFDEGAIDPMNMQQVPPLPAAALQS